MTHDLLISNAASVVQAPKAPVECTHRSRNELRPILDELLGTVAHELRSPLAGALTGVYLLASQSSLDSVARQALASMNRELLGAMRLIDDLFDVCAEGLGKLSVRKERTDLCELTARIARSTERFLTPRRHRLTVSLPPQPIAFEADPQRLEQVLVNLLGNAAKFTDPGGHIQLSAAVEEGYAVLRVRDDGRGIAPEQLPFVFDRFRQLSGPNAQRTGGLGIGLALVKVLVELHGGSVAAHSAGLGTGAEFSVRLPLDAAVSDS
jgi:two-component system CheB/CheR fusion protein